MFSVIGVFFFLTDAAYILWGLFFSDRHEVEWVGAVGLALSGVFGVFLAFYLARTHAAQGGEQASDRLDANIDDGDPEIGYFSPWSWWPFLLGLGLALAFLGLAVGIWISFIAGPIVIVAIIGWYYEYYRNNFAR
jgi:hypothetical protein